MSQAQTPAVRVQDDQTIPDPTTTTRYPGDVTLLGVLPAVVAPTDPNLAGQNSLVTGGVYDVPKDASTFSAGDPVYWNPTGNPTVGTAGTGCATSTPGGAYLMGCATQAQLTGDANVRTRLLAVPTGSNVALPDAKYATAALQNAALPAADMAGAKYVAFENTGTTPATLTTDTAAAIVAAIPNAKAGMTYVLKVRNSSGSANTATVAGGTGVTTHGTMTIAQNVTREFLVVLTSLTAVDIYSMGVSAAAA